jgi:4-amino-4-deoxy-L-arabinose transferase-like glycosyltransferase
MWQRTSAAQRWALIVAVGVLVLVAIDFWWFLHYRDGFPLDVDEAGYTTIGLMDYLGYQNGGLHGWWEAVQTQTPNAPLLPALTSIPLLVQPGVMAGFATLTGFVVVLAFATYGIGERLAGPKLGALAALIAATLPGTFLFAREYVFALPTAALLACAVCALVRSDGLRLRRWAIACGVALGLMLLARTMAVAFVPGVLVAAVVMVIARGRDDLSNRLLSLGLLIITGAAVAATWYWRNLQPVLDYLTNYGYGNQSQYYGDETSLLSWKRLSTVAERMIFSDLLVPIAALVFAGLLAVGFVAIRRVLDSHDRRAELIRFAGSDALAVLIVFVAGYAALTSSQNGGNGFTYPLAVLLPPLAVIALRYFRVAAVPALALVAAITLANLAATSTLWDDLSKPRLVDVPAFGHLPWIGGVPQAVGAIRVQAPGSESHFDERDHGWTRVDEELADVLLEPLGPGGTQPLATFASRNRVTSTNSVQLAAVLRAHRTIPLTQIVAEPTDSVANYTRQLGPEFGSPSVLVTMSRNTEDFPPEITQAYAETAAKKLGFRRIRTFELPDGRSLYVWQKRAAASPAPSPHPAPLSAPGSRRG